MIIAALLFTAEILYNRAMNKKSPMDDFKRFAPDCPYLDMRLVEEWQVLNAEVERLGGFPQSSAPAPPKEPDSRYTQRISLKHF